MPLRLTWAFGALGGTRTPNLLIRSRGLSVCAVSRTLLVQLSLVDMSALTPRILPVSLCSVARQ
jgi:hypothetical protein